MTHRDCETIDTRDTLTYNQLYYKENKASLNQRRLENYYQHRYGCDKEEFKQKKSALMQRLVK